MDLKNFIKIPECEQGLIQTEFTLCTFPCPDGYVSK